MRQTTQGIRCYTPHLDKIGQTRTGNNRLVAHSFLPHHTHNIFEFTR